MRLRSCCVATLVILSITEPAYSEDDIPGPTIDHLLPVDFDYRLDYRLLLWEKLLQAEPMYGRVLVMPSPASEGESSVSIYSRETEGKEPQFFAAYAKADRNLWYARDHPEDLFNEGTNKPINITRVDVVVPKSMALAISKALKEAIYRTRPPEKGAWPVLDGTNIEFSIVDGKRGEALYGASNPCKAGKHLEALNELAGQVVKYCEAEPSKRPQIGKRIEDAANELAADLKTIPLPSRE